MRIVTLSVVAALTAALPAQIPAKPEQGNGKTVVEIAVANKDFSTLVAAVKAAGLVETLSGKGPFTVFAPTNAAFAKLGDDTIADLLKPENKAKLTSILTYHVVAGKLPAGKVVQSKQLKTVQGHKLDVIAGEDGVTVGGAQVVKTDIMGSNGVIHVIDTVLLPPEMPVNIVACAQEAGSFNTLLAAAKAAGLADTLANDGPFTVFAPTDDAFAALGEDTIKSLLQPENKQKLQSILKLHVVSGAVMSDQAMKLDAAPTLNGQKLPLKVQGKALMVGGAKVVKADIETGNGVIHVIDKVLLPN